MKPQILYKTAICITLALSSFFPLVGAGSEDCSQEINRYVDGTRRLNITIGKQAQVKEKMVNLAATLANKLQLKGGAETLRKGLDAGFDTAKTLSLVKEDVEQDRLGDAAFDITTWAVNRIFSQLEEAPTGELGKHQKRWFKGYLESLPSGERAKAAEELAKRLTRARGGLDLGKDVDIGTAIAQFKAGVERGELDAIDTMWSHLDDSMIKESIKTLVVTTASHWAPVAITMAVKQLADELAVAGYDWVSNPKLVQMYDAYKKARSENSAWRDAFDADTAADWWRQRDRKYASDRMILTRTREVMYSLGQGVNRVTRDREHLSDEKVYQFLFKQFDAWRQEETERGNKANELIMAADSYARIKDLSCHGYIDRARKPEGEGRWESAKQRYFSSKCQAEIDRFKHYSGEYLKIRGKLIQKWYRKKKESNPTSSNRPCLPDFLAQHLACESMNPYDKNGVEYRKAYQRIVQDCGWLPNLQVTVMARFTTGNKVLGNASVDLKSTHIDGPANTAVSKTESSDNKGVTLFSNLPLGLYDLRVSAKGFAEKTLTGIEIKEPQQFPYRKRVALIPLGEVRGKILDQKTAQPIVGAQVLLTNEKEKKRVLSASDGFFALLEIPAGIYNLTVSRKGYRQRKFNNLRIPEPSGADKPVVKSGKIRLVPVVVDGILNATIISRKNQRPISGAKVVVKGKNFTATGVSNRSGEVFVSAIPYGAYTVTATASGHKPSVMSGFRINKPTSRGKIRLAPIEESKQAEMQLVATTSDDCTQWQTRRKCVKREERCVKQKQGKRCISWKGAISNPECAEWRPHITCAETSLECIRYKSEKVCVKRASDKTKGIEEKAHEAALHALCQCIFKDYLDSHTSPAIKKDYPKMKQTVKIVRDAGYDPATKRCYGRWELRTKYDRHSNWYRTTFDWNKSGGINNPPLKRLKRKNRIDQCCTVWRQTKNGTVCWRNAP